MLQHTHLHVHSDGSMKDGLGTVKRLVTGASAIGAEALALTDHGTLANAISFTIACEAAGIKPIIGIEGYVAFDGKTGHITLLADGDKGWHNLIAINNAGHAGHQRSPAFSIDTLVKHYEGIVCLTGCVASPFHQLSLQDAVKLGARLKQVYGHNLLAEIMCVADNDTWTRPQQLMAELGLKPVLTNDVHFPYRDDAPFHPVLTTIKAGYKYNSSQLWLKTPTELITRALQFIPEALATDAMKRTMTIAKKIGRVTLKRPEQLPEVEDAEAKLRSLVVEGLARYDGPADYGEAHDRAMYELDVIARMGYTTYFVILNDIIRGARELGALVGPGRGSGAGSFVLHLLGITKPDPLKFNLQFERFLNPERKGMPDVDVDFDSVNRGKVIDYAAKTWGAHPVATYARYSHKTLIHDLAVYYNVPRDIEAAAAEAGPDSAAFDRLIAKYPDLGSAYERFNGQIRNKGKHAGGIIITAVEIPIERPAAKGELVAAWTEGHDKELSYAGIVKYDLLGLSALTALQRLEKKFGYTAPPPEDHSPVFQIFRKADLAGIFQFSGSPGIANLTKELAPDEFEDLVAINALYRPGALDVGSTAKYPSWKKKPRKVHPSIADILAPTYGAIVYQEQVMAIYSRLVGGSLGDADNARRVIVKSKAGDPEWEASMKSMHEVFVASAVDKGLKVHEAEDIWTELAAHARYSFNRSHSVAYAWVAWEMAWWKFYHRAAFYAEMLNIDPGNASLYTFEAVANKIEIRPPHVNVSGDQYEAEGEHIYMPLSSVKFMGANGAEAIIKAREAGPFTSYEDFMKRVPKKLVRGNAREGMFVLGGFDGIDGAFKTLQLKIKVVPERDKASQLKYLGFVMPSHEIIKRIRLARQRGLVAGIVMSVTQKKSRFGEYSVYHTAPSGSFWSREYEFAVGDYVEVTVRKNSGRVLKVEAHE